jgi:hypothetical protein
VPAVFGDRWDGEFGIREDISGFTAGVDYLYQVLVVDGGHRSMGFYWYGNDQEMQQCEPDHPPIPNGSDWTSGDGYVSFIEILG